MSHFADEEWTDFTRNLGGPEIRARVQRHLDEGCADCARAWRVWIAVARVAGRETSFEPPETAVRRAKGRFAAHKRPAARRRRSAHP